MPVGLVVGNSFYDIGEGALLHSFFSTISHNLEPKGWGTKYPLLMNELYHGSLKWKKADKVIESLQSIKESFTHISTDKVVWDIEDLSIEPPWGINLNNPYVNDLSNYFVTNDKYDLFDVFIAALTQSKNDKKNIDIRVYTEE